MSQIGSAIGEGGGERGWEGGGGQHNCLQVSCTCMYLQALWSEL